MRFVLDNRFRIVTLDPAGNGIPPIRPDTPMATDLPVRIEAPTAIGASVCDTTVELKRPQPAARRWKR